MAEYLLSVSILIIAVFVIRGIFRKRVSPRVIYALWLIVLIRMVLPITIFDVSIETPEVLHMAGEGGSLQTQQPEEEQIPQFGTEADDKVIEDEHSLSAPIIQNATRPNTPPTDQTVSDETKPTVPNVQQDKTEKSVSYTPVQIINTVWLSGMIIFAAWFIIVGITYDRRLKYECEYYKTVNGIKVYISDGAEVPCIGIVPSIYITPNTAKSENEKYIIAHEQMHIRHKDHIWSVVRGIVLSVFWWNPLVWVAGALSKCDAELACDDAVSSELNHEERIKYASVLIDTMPQKRKYAVGFGSSPIKERILMITTKRKYKGFWLALAVILSVCAVGCSFTSLSEKETTNTDSEVIPPAADTEVPATDTNAGVEPSEIYPRIIEEGKGYYITIYGAPDYDVILTITSDDLEIDTKFYPNYLYAIHRGGITGVEILDGVTTIHKKMFRDFPHIKKVTIPDSVTTIGSEAFSGCDALESIVIPDSVTSIGAFAFSGCSSLKSIIIPDSVTDLSGDVFMDCPELETVVLSDNITKIGEYMFYGCKKLKSVVIPDSVTAIDKFAFSGCVSLSSVIIGDSVETIGYSAFSGCKKLVTVEFNTSLKIIENDAFSGCVLLEEIDLPEGLEMIGSGVFGSCEGAKNIVIPKSVERIYVSAFAGCKGVTSVIIPSSEMVLDSGALFYGCTNLKTAVIEYGVTRIGGESFGDCTSLETVEIPNSVVYIGERAFRECTSLKEIRFKGTKAEWEAVKKSDDWDLDAGDYTVVFE